jgi:hypothetical protein
MAKYPADIAKTVHLAVYQRTHKGPSLDVLTRLFETMYFVSLRTDEGRPMIFNVVYLDPANPDPKPPQRIVRDRWSYVSFGNNIPFTPPNISKLAAASDPRTSSLAVYHDKDEELIVWGLIDQGNRYHDYVNYEVEEGPERPGIFQASLEAPGNIVAYLDYQKIAELRVSSLVTKTVDIFTKGPVRDALQATVETYLSRVKAGTGKAAFQERPHWTQTLVDDWFATLCRLLLRIRSYRHGGAIILAPDTSFRGMNIKHPILYNRLRKALVSRGKYLVQRTNASDRIIDYIDRNKPIPVDLYLDETIAENELVDSRSEIDGTLWFISLLSRVDGAILMTRHLTVHGFGVEIRTSEEPNQVALCKAQEVTERSLRIIDYNHFGTRHRSMMRYCWRYPGTVGIVISQDGDIRVMTKVKDALVFWENIKIQIHTFVPRHASYKKGNAD